jgi:ABC-type uncharacterized transport system permease subunit
MTTSADKPIKATFMGEAIKRSALWLAELFPTLIGLFAGAIFTAILGLAYGINPLELFMVIRKASFGSMFAIEDTLSRSGPLMLTGLAAVVPARAGLIVLGGDGSLVLAGLAVAFISVLIPQVPGMVGIVLLLALGSLVGAALMAAIGMLRHYRGVNEVISSLLIVFIVMAIFNFLIEGVLRDPASTSFPATLPVPDQFHIGTLPGFQANWGLAIGIVACLLASLLLGRTTYGFAARIVGGNVRAAQTLGLSVRFHIITACAICGALAGLAGGIEVLAVHGQASSALYRASYGFTGVLVAFLARYHPLGVIPAAILIGGLTAAGGLMQRSFDIPGAFMMVVQGLVFVSILAAETLRQPIRARLWRALA